MRSRFEVSGGEPAVAPQLEARPVAVAPRRRWEDGDFRGQFQLTDAPQSLFQDGGFDLKLVFVAGVLIVTTTAS